MSKAIRPIFLPTNNVDTLVEDRNIGFEWHMGMSLSQRQKSIKSLHLRAKKLGIFPILEISTKSNNLTGINLSAFNLKFNIKDNKKITVEAAFQGSKVFEKGGPYREFYSLSGREIKKDGRLKSSGKLIDFDFNGQSWPIEPKTLFYDWLYINALNQNKQLNNELFKYQGFSDIAYNPKKSYSCQARSAALFVSLSRKGIIHKTLYDKKTFIDIINKYHKKIEIQEKLF